MSDSIKSDDLLLYAALGIGAYFLYTNVLAPALGIAGAAANAVAEPVANLYVALTSPASPVPQGSVIMPNGTNFPTANLTNMGITWAGNILTFTGSDGELYQLSPQSGGNYVASSYP